MDYIILYFGPCVNILIRQTRESMNKLRLDWSHIQLSLVNQSKVLPIGRLTQIPVEVEGLRTYVDFEVIDIVNDTNPYTTLLGIDLEIHNQTIINFKKRILSYEDSKLRVVAPIDLLEGQRYVETTNMKVKENTYISCIKSCLK